MSVDKSTLSSLWAIVLVGLCPPSFAAFSDVGSMFDALRPTAAATSSELYYLIAAVDAIPDPQARYDALLTLVPSADGSLRAASEGPMRQMDSVLYDRLMRVKATSGVSSGDDNSLLHAKTNREKKVKTKFKQSQFGPQDARAHISAQTKSQSADTSTDPESLSTVNNSATTPAQSAAPAQSTTDTTTAATTTEPAATDSSTTTDVAASDQSAQTESAPLESTELAELDKGVWAQLVGNNTGQDERYNVPGYDADVLGLLIGRDHLFSDKLMVGAAMGYVHARADSRGPSGSFLEIDRYQLTLYAGMNFEDPFFINGSVTLAYNDYENSRKILVPPYGGIPFVRIAWADFGSWETNAHIEGGYRWVCGHFHVIPKMMLTFSQFNVNGYFESDAFGLDLDVKYQDMTFIPLGLGVKFEYQNEFENVYVIPEMHIYGFHDFKHQPQTAKALFTAGGYDFLSQGAAPASNSFEIGAGLAIHSYQNTAVTFQYDYAARHEYHRNSAFIKIRHEWA